MVPVFSALVVLSRQESSTLKSRTTTENSTIMDDNQQFNNGRQYLWIKSSSPRISLSSLWKHLYSTALNLFNSSNIRNLLVLLMFWFSRDSIIVCPFLRQELSHAHSQPHWFVSFVRGSGSIWAVYWLFPELRKRFSFLLVSFEIRNVIFEIRTHKKS